MRATVPPVDHTLTIPATAAVAAAGLAPFVGGRPANEIPVERASADESPELTTGAAWADVPAVTVPLSSAPSGVPSADNTSVERMTVQAVRTDSRLYLRVSWPDATRDGPPDDPRAFEDAAAVQFPVNESTRPSIAMGSPRNLVNVWFWTPTNSQELLAGGAGSTTRFGNDTVVTNATHAEDRWTVVYGRQLDASGANRTSISLERDVDVAFAVWNGSNMERSGQKAVSEWHYLALGPGPQGPPWEAFLWAVAGLAIVVVAFVTVSAVRRA